MYKNFIVIVLLAYSSVFALNVDLLQIGAGINNVHRPNSYSTEFRAEYQSHIKWWVFNPIAGASMTTKKQFFAYGGINLDMFPMKYFAISINFAPGFYYKGDGKDLGFPLEFRSGIAAAVVFKNNVRIGSHFSHTSNASLGRKNPGLETLIFFLSIPLSKH